MEGAVRIICLLAAGAFAAQPASAESLRAETCRKADDIRTIDVISPGTVGLACDVVYSRDGGANVAVPYNANVDKDFCRARAAELAKHMLEKTPPDMSRYLLSPMPGLLVEVAVKPHIFFDVTGQPGGNEIAHLIGERGRRDRPPGAVAHGDIASVMQQMGRPMTAVPLLRQWTSEAQERYRQAKMLAEAGR